MLPAVLCVWTAIAGMTLWEIVGQPALASETVKPPTGASAGATSARLNACTALPPREPMPRQAVPEQLDSPDWRQRDAALDAQLAGIDRSKVKLVFIGDSITQYWDPSLFHQFYGSRAALNLGLWGDFTEGALWRLQHDQWGSLNPRLTVLLIGTNNTQWGGAPEDVALGVAELVRFIHARAPDSKILLVGILPRGADMTEKLRAVNAQVNTLIARCADGRKVFFRDVGRILLDAEGRLSEQVSFDRLHPTMVGYALLASTLEPTIKQLLGD